MPRDQSLQQLGDLIASTDVQETIDRPIAEFTLSSRRDAKWLAQRGRLLSRLVQASRQHTVSFGKALALISEWAIYHPAASATFALREEDGRVEAGVSFRFPDQDPQPLIDRMADRADALRSLQSESVRIRLFDAGTAVFVWVGLAIEQRITDFSSEQRKLWALVLTMRSIESAIVERQRLSRQTDTDGLSGTPNRQRRLDPATLSLTESSAELLALVAIRTDNSAMILGPDGDVQWCNNGFTKTTGYELSDIRGQRIDSILAGPETTPAARRSIADALDSGHGVAQEIARYRQDGRCYWELLNLTPVFDAAGSVAQWVAIGSDVTLRRLAEESLGNAKEAAEAASRAKSDFLANMSHEIRTPMNAVIGMTELALETDLTDQQREYLTTTHESAKTLLGLLNDILDLSKIESGKMEIEHVPFDLPALIGSVSKPMAMQAQRKGLQFTSIIDSAVPTTLVGDPNRLRQILVNLIGNAVKFTVAGEIGIHVVTQWATEKQAALQFSIRDTGIGIANAKLEKIFDAFSQADASVSRQFGGTGLGLTISNQLVTLMDGRIWVQSKFGQGTTFHFSVKLDIRDAACVAELPFPQVSQVDDPQVSRISQRKQASSLASLGFDKPLQVLIADDNEANRLLASRILQRRGHTVAAVNNGQSAIDLAAQQWFDVILMDVQMPRVDGYQATQQIRQQSASLCRDTSIIAMTAHAMHADRQRCLSAGMDEYISKPIDANELCRLVESTPRGATSSVSASPSLVSVARVAGTSTTLTSNNVNQNLSASSVSNKPPVSTAFAVSLRRLDGDVELLHEQMQLFLRDDDPLIQRLAQAIESRDAKLTELTAHRLKGIVSSFDHAPSTRLTAEIERLGRTNQFGNKMEIAMQELRQAIADLSASIHKFLET